MQTLIDTYMTKEAPAGYLKKDIKDGMQFECAMTFRPASTEELKALGDNLPDGFVAGWASTPDLDSYGHVVATGAFTRAIAERGLSGPLGIKLLIGHNWDQLGGVIKKLEYRGDSLWIEAQLELELSYARDAYIQAKMLGGLSFSVGFFLKEYTWDTTDDPEIEFLHIKRGDLFEVSVVVFPGNDQAQMQFVKDGGPEPTTAAELERRLVAKGLTKNRSDAHRIILEMKQYGHLVNDKIIPATVLKDVTPPLPVLDAKALDTLGDLVAKMKAVFNEG